MSKKRVYELAKDIGVANKELIKMMGKLDIEVKNHMSSVEDEDVAKMTNFYSRDKSKELDIDKAKAKKEMTKTHVHTTKSVPTKPVPTKPVKQETTPVKSVETSTEKPIEPSKPMEPVKPVVDHRIASRPGYKRTDGVKTNNNNNRNNQNRGPQTNQTGTGARPQSTTQSSNRPSGSNDSRNSRPQGNRPQGSSGPGNASRPQGSSGPGNASRPQNSNQQSGGAQGNRTSNNNNRPSSNNNRPGSKTQEKAGQGKGDVAEVYKGKPTNNIQSNKTKQGNKSQNKPPYTKASAKPKKSRASYRKEKRDAVAATTLAKEIEMESEGVIEEDGVRMIQVPESITAKNLSIRIGVQTSDVIKVLFAKGIMATANQEVDYETAAYVAGEFDVLVEKEEVLDILETFFEDEVDEPDQLVKRPPVVVVMGHVDHGKTSLLDAIRNSSVTEDEHGGITQHIGASVVSMPDGQKVTFLDTPGHEAFTAMRLRGALATDIAILVVAADDGVMPQTIEAINHAKAAGVQIIIAINKIDKPGANPDRVKQELIEFGLVTEDWGGETIAVPVSAIEKTNLDQLLEMILLVAEVEDYKANPNKKAKGIVIESQLDKGRGPVATVLVQQGTLKIGDAIVAGVASGRIRAMFDDHGNRVKSAGPSKPVEVLGLSEVPLAGETFYIAKNEREARHVAEKVQVAEREKMLQHTPHKVTLDDLFSQIQAGEVKELKLIVKADVQGSVEAVKQSLLKLSNQEVMINIIHGGVGAVNESDVMLASASNAIIIGFNVRPENSAKVTADREEIDIRLYRVIYNAIEDIETAMKGMLDPIFKEKVIGQAEVRQTFKVSGVGTIAGCYMIDGKMTRNAKVRVVREGIVVFEGELDSLKRFKDDVKEVAKGFECGITIEKFNDLKEGDIIEGFIMEEVPRT